MYKLPKRKFSLKHTIVAVLIIIAYACVFFYSFYRMTSRLHEERVAQTDILMGKINQTVGVGVEAKWARIDHFANMFERYGVSHIEMAQQQMKYMIEDSPEPNTSSLFLIDEAGNCYSSDGTNFVLQDKSILETKGEFYVSSEAFDKDVKNTPRMYFITSFSTLKKVGDIKVSHIALSCEMKFLDSYFDLSDYGDDCIALIIDEAGKEVYRQNDETFATQGKNLYDTLGEAEFKYQSSLEKLKLNIEKRNHGCISVEYRGTEYFIAYRGLKTKDWTSVLLIPSEYVGSATEGFVTTITTTTTLVVLGAAAVLATFWVTSSKRRTKEMNELNERLAKAAEAEREANLAKTQFLSSMSHDIRTPMNAIIGMTTLANKHIDDTHYVKNCLSKVTLASNHLLTLVNDVLDISKVESGRMMLNPIVFSIAETSNNVVNIVKQQINSKAQNFDIRVHNIKHEYLFADELRLNQIFINLLSNAVKYTPEGGRITLDLKEEAVPKCHDKVRIVYIVEDNGIGMSEEFMKTMYDAFARASANNLGNVQGTGLGLAICRQMVNLMGGSINCESEIGKGTKFTVTLELPIAENFGDDLSLPPMHVLLVDDDEIFLETAADTLSELGMIPDCVSSGEDALEAVETKHKLHKDYPVVIIDWQLPGMNGIETTRAIREKVGEDVPIIVISAYDRSDIEEEALRAGANGFISKPFFPSAVYRDMSEILGINEFENKDSSEKKSDDAKDFGGVSLLVAEDNDLNWEIVHEILSMYNIKTERAENGKICVDMINAAEDGKYDMILMDIKMPVMNGYEATHEIRSAERDYVKNIPIIAMTADAFAEDIQSCMDAGMNAHLPKPINVANLLAVIGNFGGGALMPGKLKKRRHLNSNFD